MARTTHPKPSKGPCFWCLRIFKWVPVLFIMIVIFWSYYAYVVQLCITTVKSTSTKIIFLTIYHLIFIMFYWSYVQTIFTEIGRVPDKFRLPDGEYELLMCAESDEMQRQILENFSRNLPVNNRTATGSIRYCDKCRHVKPDRAHHCSVCGQCVLKMDHHCPWINNCVNFTNYKCFVLFLGYALIYCLFVSLTSMKYFVQFWNGELQGGARFHILFLFFVAVMFALSLVSLFVYHCYLVSNNRSTLEAFRAPIFRTGSDKNGYSLGTLQNFKEVFGKDPKLWFIPICNSSGDGIQFPVQSRHQQSSYQSMECTQASTHEAETESNKLCPDQAALSIV